MKKKVGLYLSLIILIFLISCNSKVSTSISKSYPPLKYNEVVIVIGLHESLPANYEEIGIVRIGDSGFSTNCNYNTAIDNAIIEARKAGGNAIKIMSHKKPHPLGSTCHRIEAAILKVSKNENNVAYEKTYKKQIGLDYAILRIYCFPKEDSKLNYDIYLGNDNLCKVSNSFKTALPIKKDGYNSLWTDTNPKIEIPINVKFGKEYYIRCGSNSDIKTKQPTIKLVDNETGKSEYESFEAKNP